MVNCLFMVAEIALCGDLLVLVEVPVRGEPSDCELCVELLEMRCGGSGCSDCFPIDLVCSGSGPAMTLFVIFSDALERNLGVKDRAFVGGTYDVVVD